MSELTAKTNAVNTMTALRCQTSAINAFDKFGLVTLYDPPEETRTLTWEDSDELELIQELQNKEDLLVYAIVRSYFIYGVVDSFLFAIEQENMEPKSQFGNFCCLAYTYNYRTDEWGYEQVLIHAHPDGTLARYI